METNSIAFWRQIMTNFGDKSYKTGDKICSSLQTKSVGFWENPANFWRQISLKALEIKCVGS